MSLYTLHSIEIYAAAFAVYLVLVLVQKLRD